VPVRSGGIPRRFATPHVAGPGQGVSVASLGVVMSGTAPRPRARPRTSRGGAPPQVGSVNEDTPAACST
jgi:hypothetical protein